TEGSGIPHLPVAYDRLLQVPTGSLANLIFQDSTLRPLTVQEVARAISLFFLGMGLVLAASAVSLPEASKADPAPDSRTDAAPMPSVSRRVETDDPVRVSFRDVTKPSGIRFVHRFDLKNGKMTVTQGGGAALADYDGDGRL